MRQVLAMSVLIAGSTFATAPVMARNAAAKYRITVRNATAGNVLSPFFAVAYTAKFPLFSLGDAASPGLAQLAETGSTAGLAAELAGRDDIATTAKASAGPATAGQTSTADLTLDLDAVTRGAKVTLAAMIGRSNDSFIALPGVTLATIPLHGRYTWHATNFDAGSEENTGFLADFGAGGHPIEHAEGRVSYDRGLNPRGDAPDAIVWGPIVADVTIERVQ